MTLNLRGNLSENSCGLNYSGQLSAIVNVEKLKMEANHCDLIIMNESQILFIELKNNSNSEINEILELVKKSKSKLIASQAPAITHMKNCFMDSPLNFDHLKKFLIAIFAQRAFDKLKKNKGAITRRNVTNVKNIIFIMPSSHLIMGVFDPNTENTLKY